mmetsp:Transcript_19877/g.44622  ORF Transcript_19877/g.44622 Transcript_19877/m.44622 type:complete len:619 (-) Transcript_19877:467-2323(-)
MARHTLDVLANRATPIENNPNWTKSDCGPSYRLAQDGEQAYLISGSCFWGQWVRLESLSSQLPLSIAKKIRIRAELFWWSGWTSRGPHVHFRYADWRYRFDMFQGRALATSRSAADSQSADLYISSGDPDVVSDEYYTFESLIDLERNSVNGFLERQSTGRKWYWSDMNLTHEYDASADLDGHLHTRLDSIGSAGHRTRGWQLTVFTGEESGASDDVAGVGLTSTCTHNRYLFVLPAEVTGDCVIPGSEGVAACELREEAATRFFNVSHGDCNTTSRTEENHIVDILRAVCQPPRGTVYFQDNATQVHELHCRRPRFANETLDGVDPVFTTITGQPNTQTATPEDDGVSLELRAGPECQRTLAAGEQFPADEAVMCLMAKSERENEGLSFVDCAAIADEDGFTQHILVDACAHGPFNPEIQHGASNTSLQVRAFRISGYGSYGISCTLERCVGGPCRTCGGTRRLQGVGSRSGSAYATVDSVRVAPGSHVMTLPGREPDVVLLSNDEGDDELFVAAAPEAACCFRLSIHLGGPEVCRQVFDSVVTAAAGPHFLESILASSLQPHAEVQLESVRGVAPPAMGDISVPAFEAMNMSYLVKPVGDGDVELMAQQVQGYDSV